VREAAEIARAFAGEAGGAGDIAFAVCVDEVVAAVERILVRARGERKAAQSNRTIPAVSRWTGMFTNRRRLIEIRPTIIRLSCGTGRITKALLSIRALGVQPGGTRMGAL